MTPKDLTSDSARLLKILDDCGQWQPAKDTKLASLLEILVSRAGGRGHG